MKPLNLFNAIVLGGSMLVAGCGGGSSATSDSRPSAAPNGTEEPDEAQPSPTPDSGEEGARPAGTEDEGGGHCAWNFVPRPE